MGGGEMPYKIPDWKTYQVGKHTPELEQVQRMLSSLGLKVSWSLIIISDRTLIILLQDPWIRNEVWRFDRRMPDMADRPVLVRRLLTRGMLPGFCIAVVTAGIHYYLESKHSHADSHH